MDKVALFEEDEDELGAIRSVYTTQCKFKYCRKMDTDRNNAQAMDIDLVNETFYACQFCEQAFAVHEECYGGHDLSAKVANEGIALMKDDFVIEEYRPAYLDEEEEKEVEVWSYVEEETEKSRKKLVEENKDAGASNQQ